VPRDKFAGASYQEALRALPCYSDQLIFEMMNGSRETLLDMAQIYNEGIATATIKLEEISWDKTGIAHGQLSAHLVDDSLLLPLIKSVFLRNSLFSLPTPPRHARTMVSPSAKDDVSGRVQQMYGNLFGDLHLDLGYKD